MKIGIIGLGEMGFPMGKNLLTAGYGVTGYDIRPEVLKEWEMTGGIAKSDIPSLLADCEVILCCLPSSEAFVSMAEKVLLPCMTAGQVLVETGTTEIGEVRRLSVLFAGRGIAFLDAPMSGGPGGVVHKKLQVFVGGTPDDFRILEPIFSAYAGSEWVYHCGPAGQGQVAKGINQLFSGLGNAVCLEILALAARENLPMSLVVAMYRHKFPMIVDMAERISRGDGEKQGIKFRELPYYMEHARKSGYHLPITETIYAFCESGERVSMDDHRSAPSYWHELMR